MQLENIDAEVVNVVWGLQYTFAARFLDNRGALIESALKLFENSREVEINIGDISKAEELQLKSKSLLIRINPYRTTIQTMLPSSLDEFYQLIKQFCDEQPIKTFFSNIEFNFIGSVYKVKGDEVDKIASRLLSKCRNIFKCPGEGITFTRVTYIDGNYRVHITLSLNPITKRYELDLDTQKIHSINFSEAPLLVKESYNRLKDFLHQFKPSIKKEKNNDLDGPNT